MLFCCSCIAVCFHVFKSNCWHLKKNKDNYMYMLIWVSFRATCSFKRTNISMNRLGTELSNTKDTLTLCSQCFDSVVFPRQISFSLISPRIKIFKFLVHYSNSNGYFHALIWWASVMKVFIWKRSHWLCLIRFLMCNNCRIREAWILWNDLSM